MPRYLYTIRMTRPAMKDDPTPQEQAIMGEHFAYLKARTEAGELLLAGPCLDAAFGIVIFDADSDDAARAIMENDPSVIHGVMQADLHPFRISLLSEHIDTG